MTTPPPLGNTPEERDPTVLVPSTPVGDPDGERTVIVSPPHADDGEGISIPGLEGYSHLQLIAHGSSAIVYRAQQDRLKRPVAIKLLLIDDVMTTLEGVQFELEMLVRLSQQASIVGIIDTGVTEAGQPYIVMEYCEGGSYAQILKENGPLPVEDVIEVGIKIGETLHAAHEVGIVHRDVKPHNILLSRFGPKLTDFGIAYNDQLSATTTFMKLTPHHASPETLLQQNQTGRSDLYSLASTLWNLLAGKPPFAGPGQNPEEFRRRVLTQPVPRVPRADVPDWLQAELTRAMAKRPAHRHLNALEFAETLRIRLVASQSETPWEPPSPVDDAETMYVPRSTSPQQSYEEIERVPQPTSPPDAVVISPGVYAPAPTLPAPEPNPYNAQAPPQAAGPYAPQGAPQQYGQYGQPGQESVLVPVVEPTPSESEQPSPRSPWPRLLLAGGVIGVLLGLIVALGVVVFSGDTSDPEPEPTPTPSATPTVTQITTDEFTPQNVQVSVDEDGKATLRWTDVSDGAAVFVIIVSEDGSDPLPVGTADAGETTATTTEPLDRDVKYCFIVAAIVKPTQTQEYQSLADPVCVTRTE